MTFYSAVARLSVFGLLALSACSGLPPDTLLPLPAGDIAVGAQVGVDLRHLRRPDLSLWVGAGLGHGIDIGIGADAVSALLVAGPRAAGLVGTPPGLMVRKTWANGLGVGLGTSSRLDVGRSDSLSVGLLSTAGVLVTAGPKPGAWQGGRWGGTRATALIGVAALRPTLGASPTTHLALLGRVQTGRFVTSADTTAVSVGGRLQGGLLLSPRVSILYGPTPGAFVLTTPTP